MTGKRKAALFVVLTLSLGSAALAQSTRPESGSTSERVGRIATEPARDVGLQRTTIPAVLERIGADPYAMRGVGSCARIATALAELDAVLGPDFDSPPPPRSGTRAGRIAEAGGRAVVNSLIPFRGVVRELSGSAGADRRLQAAIDAGIARRGFLRGVRRMRGCG